MKQRLIIIGPLPPPSHGVTVSTALVLDNHYLADHFYVRHVDTSDRRGLETIGQWDLQNILCAVLSIARFFRELRGPDRGVVYLPLSQGLAGFARDSAFINLAACRKWKVAVHLHGGEFDRFYVKQTRVVRWWIRLTLRRLDSVAVLGNSLRRMFDGLVPHDRIAVIPNGTPLPGAPADDRDRQLGIFLSNLWRRKGVIEAVRAATLVAAREPRARFVFVGGWEDQRLETEARSIAAAVGMQIRFEPVMAGIAKDKLLARAGFLLFPPVEAEGHPRVILEALAAGLPVITTNRGAIAETVVDGESGFVLDDPDPDRLADRMLWLIRDAALSERMSAAAWRRYRDCYTQETADQRIASWLSGASSS